MGTPIGRGRSARATGGPIATSVAPVAPAVPAGAAVPVGAARGSPISVTAVDPGTVQALVVDAQAADPLRPSWVARGVATFIGTLGLQLTVRAGSVAEALDPVVDDVLVLLLVVHPTFAVPEPPLRPGSAAAGVSQWPDGGAGLDEWEHPRWLTAEICGRGLRTWAVGVGASAAALAGCLEAGAQEIVDLGQLPDRLARWPGARAGEASTRTHAAGARPRTDARVPALVRDLMSLTPSERRVLSYLARGASAADIADELVVSVATVRAHIRAILRKLHVGTQLAAVALAHGARWPMR